MINLNNNKNVGPSQNRAACVPFCLLPRTVLSLSLSKESSLISPNFFDMPTDLLSPFQAWESFHRQALILGVGESRLRPVSKCLKLGCHFFHLKPGGSISALPALSDKLA